MTAALILALLGASPRAEATANRLAPMFESAARMGRMDPRLVVAVAFHESSLRDRKRGAAGEIGIMQIKPGGQARYRCRGMAWRTSTRDNIRCGVRILSYARQRCSGPPVRWLGIYNGIRRCGPSLYAQRVLRHTRRRK